MRKRLDNNTILSITATIVSVCALFVAAYQTILMRQQQSAAVWPKLIISHGYIENAGKDSFYRLYVRNVGIGPAVIRDVVIERPNQSFKNVEAYTDYVRANRGRKDSTFVFDYSDLFSEDVIPQGERKLLIDAKGEQATRLFIANRDRFTFSITYSSAYGEEGQAQYPKRETK